MEYIVHTYSAYIELQVLSDKIRNSSLYSPSQYEKHLRIRQTST